VPIMRESVVQIPVVSTPLEVCFFIMLSSKNRTTCFRKAKAKDSRYRKLKFSANYARIGGSDSGCQHTARGVLFHYAVAKESNHLVCVKTVVKNYPINILIKFQNML